MEEGCGTERGWERASYILSIISSSPVRLVWNVPALDQTPAAARDQLRWFWWHWLIAVNKRLSDFVLGCCCLWESSPICTNQLARIDQSTRQSILVLAEARMQCWIQAYPHSCWLAGSHPYTRRLCPCQPAGWIPGTTGILVFICCSVLCACLYLRRQHPRWRSWCRLIRLSKAQL